MNEQPEDVAHVVELGEAEAYADFYAAAQPFLSQHAADWIQAGVSTGELYARGHLMSFTGVMYG